MLGIERCSSHLVSPSHACHPPCGYVDLVFCLWLSAMLPPFVFISVYTVDSIPLITPQLSVMPLALLNIASAVSRAITSVVMERFGAHKTFVAVLLFAGLSELIWAFAGTSYIRIAAFACLNGAFGTTFLVVLPCLLGHLFPKADKTSLAGTMIIFGAPGKSGLHPPSRIAKTHTIPLDSV